MKKFILQIRSIINLNKLLLILLSFDFIGLHAQKSTTDIIPPGATVTKLSSNQFIFTEAPVWYGDSVLLFVDDGISSPNIFSYNPIRDLFSVFHNYSVNYNGLACDTAGNLIACESNTKSIVLMDKAGEVIKKLAGSYNGKNFNGPNDLIADNKGGIYFTDPVFISTPVQDKKAVYYINPTGDIKRVIDVLSSPNGVILSPNGTKLYVVDTDNKYLYSWDVGTDGSVSGKLNLAVLQTTGGASSGADGLAIDVNGNIYIASDKGVQVFSSQGAAITVLATPEMPTNCDFGGMDFKTLYITAQKNLYSIDLNYPGYAVSRKNFTTGINQIPDKHSVVLYPNPVTDFLHVHLDIGKVHSIEILNTEGKMEANSLKKVDGTDIDIYLQYLTPGMYLLRISSNEGIVTRTFVKE